tara:strand:+ start:644 stop:1030 length:387 start_codon:yes stop_codon:yes gene_type:complete
MWWTQIKDCINKIKDMKIDYDDDVCVEWKTINYLNGTLEDKQEIIIDLRKKCDNLEIMIDNKNDDIESIKRAYVDTLTELTTTKEKINSSYLIRFIMKLKRAFNYRLKLTIYKNEVNINNGTQNKELI